jgi:hypothetical protein
VHVAFAICDGGFHYPYEKGGQKMVYDIFMMVLSIIGAIGALLTIWNQFKRS